jgi:hypothetical protein
MSEHQRHTAFLKRLVSFGDTRDCKELLERIQNAERDERSVRRKISGLILLVLLSIIGFGYVKLFAPDHFFYAWPVLVRLFSVLSLGAVIGLVFFTGFWCWCRAVLNGLRDEARRLVQPILEQKLETEGLGSHTQHLQKSDVVGSEHEEQVWLKAA